MPTIQKHEALGKLADVVEKAKATTLAEFTPSSFPRNMPCLCHLLLSSPNTSTSGLEAAEEIVDLWNVVFPATRNVWYDEEDEKIHYNEEVPGYAEPD